MNITPIATLRALSVEQQDKAAKAVASREVSLKRATDAHKSSFPEDGKLVCVVEERLNDLKSDRNQDGTPKKRQVAANTSLAAYWESITKVKGTNGKPVKLNSHALSCAVAFGTYVRSELISETDYDKCKSAWLETSASISTECGGDVTHDAVNRAAEELRERSKDIQSNLDAILVELKGPKEMTAEQAEKALAKIMAAGYLNLVISGVGAEIAHVEDPEIARNAFFGIQLANEMFSANTMKVDGNDVRRFSDDTLDGWQNAYIATTATGQAAAALNAPKTPVAQAA